MLVHHCTRPRESLRSARREREAHKWTVGVMRSMWSRTWAGTEYLSQAGANAR